MNFKPGQELNNIISDNISGSGLLLEKLNNYLLNNFNEIDTEYLIPYLKKNLSEFSNIKNYLNDLENFLRNNPRRLEYFLKDVKNKSSNLAFKIYKNSFHELNKYNKFITISNSNTVIKFFEQFPMDKKNISVAVCESRPILEGRLAAIELLNSGANVKIITEAMIAKEINKIDAAVIGADSILRNGNVVNKIGSRLIAVLCKYYNKPFYVLADKSKISNTNKFIPKKKPMQEIWDGKPGKIKIENYYFEVIEKELITNIFTD
ncbi:MAG: translation initiation factor eIF-2B [Bacteroidetes bacterium]|nr:translation initiation factor eIF-2B [Bacteroidota bacterium]